ncbi:MAG: VCBS repeat-containing protein, partial [Planctomycetota bacterium]|nr:VCBS repeat-containing protein [Planctomycetota bacterium]
MRSSMILLLGFFAACAPDEPRAVDSPGWLKIQEFGPAVEIPRDGVLRLEYGVTGGAAVFDADGDGDLDILFTGTGPESPTRLWRQTNRLEFVDATEGAGFDATFFGIGATAGDIDGDGDVDVLLTGRSGCQLYKNDGTGSFEQSTQFLAPKCSSSATLVDFDLDGDLDLFVCRYADISLNPDKECRDPAGRLELCGPTAHPALHDLLLSNDGNGTFTDVSVQHGLDRVAAAGLGVVVDDFTGDDLLDLYVANDGYENHLWVMGEDGFFTEQAAQRGLALNLMGETEAGMGVVSLDVDGDMAPDLYCTHLAAESNTLYIGKNNAFLDSTAPLGLGVASMPRTGFGVVARDFNRDGHEDLL